MKTVYLVRHGQSILNVPETKIFERDMDAPLTETGVAQTLKIAERAGKLSFEALIASPWVRTKATAEAIAAKTGHAIEYSDLFVERRTPSSLDGLERGSDEFKRRFREWEGSFFVPDLRVDDGDNFLDIKTRAIAALEYLRTRREERILVSTHGFFLRALMATIIFGNELTPQEFGKIYYASQTDNTGLSMFVYGCPVYAGLRGDRERWCIKVYNDHAHLG